MTSAIRIRTDASRLEQGDHHDHDGQRDERMDRLPENGAERVDGVRDRALADVRFIRHEAAAAVERRVAEESPDGHSRQHRRRVADRVAVAEKVAEDDGEDDRHRERVEQRPADARARDRR